MKWDELFSSILVIDGPVTRIDKIVFPFHGRHNDLVDLNGLAVSQMTTDMFHLS